MAPSDMPAPPKKSRKALVIVLSAVLAVLLLGGGGAIFFSWWSFYTSKEMVQAKPHADSLTPFPTGERPASIDTLAVFHLEEVDSYKAYNGVDDISFRTYGTDYWDSAVKGSGWEPKGDLLCETQFRTPGAFCVLAFEDATPTVDTRDALIPETERLTALYLAARRGEPREPWPGITPPNLDSLGSVAAPTGDFPEYLGPWSWGYPFAGTLPADEQRHWAAGFADPETGLGVTYTALNSTDLWGYYSSAVGMEPLGDALCSEDDPAVTLCILAGNDGMVVVEANVLGFAPEELLEPLVAVLD